MSVKNKITFTDFDGSFLTFIVKKYANYGRFKIESVCSLISGGRKEAYYLLSPVMACNVYAKDKLIKEPAYMFQAMFSKNQFKIFRTYLENMTQDNNSGLIENNFEGIEISMKEKDVALLKSKKDIISFARENSGIYGRIFLPDNVVDEDVKIEIDFPIKHINVNPETDEFQVETGTIAFPDFSIKTNHEIDCFYPSYIAFNCPNKIDVIKLPALNRQQKDCLINLYGYN